MASPGGGLIDFRALEKELKGCVRAEERYQRENCAKLRAVSQRVNSYDEFRSLVLASHLRPLDKHDKQGAPRKQPWNPVTAGNGTSHMTSGNGTSHMTSDTSHHGNNEMNNLSSRE